VIVKKIYNLVFSFKNLKQQYLNKIKYFIHANQNVNLKQNHAFPVSGKPDGYTSLQFGTNVCFYVSNNPIWPYDTSSSTYNNAAFNCSKMNLNLAVINSDAERTALWNLFRNDSVFTLIKGVMWL
jgi:hypothetical protein